MTATLSDSVRDVLRKPDPAVMATLANDGGPFAVATWYLPEEDDRVLMDLDASRARLGHLPRDPRSALDVLDGVDWCTHVALQLVGVEFTDDTELTDIDALSPQCTGSPSANRESPRVSLRAEIRGVLTRSALR